MAGARTRMPQHLLIVKRRGRLGGTIVRWRWPLLAATLFVLYRSVPHPPDTDLAEAVSQHLRFDYSRSRSAELEQHAARRQADELLAVTDDVLSARIEVNDMEARGPVFPAPLPRRAMVSVRYRVMKGRSELASEERWLEFQKDGDGLWRHRRDRSAAFYWLYPL
jgi:hypothetical protein